VRAALEIDAQARSQGLERAWLVLAAGSGGTLAGLMAGFWLAQSSLSLLGIDVGKLWKAFPASIARLASEVCSRLGSPHTFLPEHVPLIEARYVGPGYARPSAEAQEAIQIMASHEGIFLDPVYTGKAFAGLLDLTQRQALGKDEPVVFLHSGGAPALFSD
jgi:D-cysteine desulfhydrase